MLVHGGIHVSKETNIAAKMKQVEDIKHTTVGEESQQSITTEHNSKLIETTQSYQYSLHNVTVKEYIDPCGAYQVQDRIKHVLKQWENVKPQTPTLFLQKMMVKRGHDATPIPALQSKFKRAPTQKQLLDYGSELVVAVRNSDLVHIKKLHAEGYSMSACNKFGESIVHMACRRASFEVVDFILKNGGSSWTVDDFGRTPLHDACWRSEPRFDIVTLLLNICPELILVQDVRGSQALDYVRDEHWLHWCAYFFHQRDRYFPNNVTSKITEQ